MFLIAAGKVYFLESLLQVDFKWFSMDHMEPCDQVEIKTMLLGDNHFLQDNHQHVFNYLSILFWILMPENQI